ncbi:hypothetical protein AQJ23_29000 [Streptomyces antibioticus]|nr:FxsC protein [Streptomyces antibioticus]KUN22091.1 hypothetical protein AQJ23_29000 [Streptomyces antibioticus]
MTYDGRAPRGSRDKAPHFFLSYAPAPSSGGESQGGCIPADKNVKEFYTDLTRAVAGGSGLLTTPSLGYLDAERGGPVMLRALQRCHSFVPLITRRYFADGYCGRQWSVFARRAHPKAVVPVLWTPVPTTAVPVVVKLGLPVPDPPLTPVHVDEDALYHYARRGLYGLRQSPDRPEYYDQCVRRIAQCVVQAARRVPEPAPGEAALTDLADVPDAFAASSWHPLGIAVLAPDTGHLPPDRSDTKYGAEPRDWQPFSDGLGTALVDRTAELARNLGFAPEIHTYDEAEAVFLGRREATSPWVLILDPWVLHDRAAIERLRAFDARDLPWVSVLTPLADDPQTWQARETLDARLREALPRRLNTGRAIQRGAAAGIDNSETFNSRFIELADSAAQQYLNRPSPSSTSNSASADTQGDQEAQS